MRQWIYVYALALSLAWPVAAGDLLVFMPGGSKGAVGKALAGKTKENVQVFTKVRKLEKAMKGNPAAAVVAPLAALEFNSKYQLALKGTKGGAAGEKYFIVAANDKVNMGNLGTRKVGVWNVMGRKNIKPFVKKYFGKSLKTKQVSKREDLLTMMGVDLVAAVVVSESDLNWMKKKTDMTLRVLAESKSPVGFISVAIPKGGNAAGVAGLSKVPSSFLKKFSFSEWRAAK
jgi:hypothetical protein